MDKQEIEYFIAENLNELAWRNNYPINENAGVWCFLNGLQRAGFIVDINHQPFKIFDTFRHKKKTWEISTSISIEEIVEGLGQAPKASPLSFYKSVFQVIDQMQLQVKASFPESSGIRGYPEVPIDVSEALSLDRKIKGNSASKLMGDSFRDYFAKYQEGFLLRMGNHSSEIHAPIILPVLFKTGVINLERINQALVRNQRPGTSDANVETTISFLRNDEASDTHSVITESKVYGYIFGNYLLKLANLKNYALREYRGQGRFGILEKACDIGWNILDKAQS